MQLGSAAPVFWLSNVEPLFHLSLFSGTPTSLWLSGNGWLSFKCLVETARMFLWTHEKLNFLQRGQQQPQLAPLVGASLPAKHDQPFAEFTSIVPSHDLHRVCGAKSRSEAFILTCHLQGMNNANRGRWISGMESSR